MAGRDVLICGNCNIQLSDLKLFLDHKQSCGNTTSVTNNGDVCNYVSPSPGQQTSHFGSQQIVIPMQGHASIVSLPVGMPHVILQASSGLSQMYRIVLEPSINAPAQINSSLQISQASQMPNILQPVNSQVETQYAASSDKTESVKEVQDISTLSQKDNVEENLALEADSMPLNSSSITRLTPVNPIDTTWSANKMESSSVNFSNVASKHVDEKSYKNLSSPSLHTEEEVATFLATQLVSQTNAPSQNSKTKANSSESKHNISIEETSFNHRDVEFINVNEKVEGSTPEKINVNDLKIKDCSVSGGLNNNIQEGNHAEPAVQCTTIRGRKQLVCSYRNCSFLTMHKTDMIRHSRKHTGEKPFECPECGKRLSRQDKLKVHLRIHSKERPYACTEPGCTYRGNEKAHLKKHIRTHTNERPFRCQFCSYGAKDGSHLAVHLRFHTGDAPFHCQVDGCSATFKTSSDLKRHGKLHTGERPFKCFECDYASSLKANLKAHVRINHSKDKRFTCKTCLFSANSRKQIKDHEVTHTLNHQYVDSKEEDSKFPRKTEPTEGQGVSPKFFNVPFKKIKFPKGRPTSKPVFPKNFVCIECGSDFVREDSYRSHIRQHEQKHKDNEKISKEKMDEALGKGKIKSVYTLNYSLQGNGAHLVRIDDPQKDRCPVGKDEKMEPNLPTSNNIENTNSQSSTAEVLHAGPGHSESFPYMITIDGMPSVYSNPPPILKSQTSHQPSQNSMPEDPVVHILTPVVNSSSFRKL